MKDITKKYSNGEVTIVWQPSLCIHSAICWRGENGLPQVFDPSEKPWIKPGGAETKRIIEQIKKCPSGALSYFMNEEKEKNSEITSESIVEITPNGPLLVYGNITVKDSNGNTTKKHKITAFCRCGGSCNKPFCDGTHRKINFEG
jgi:uncharacterized Fe-S cluster protein YjdI